MNPKQFGEDIEFSTAWIHIFADNVEADFPAAADRQAKRPQFSTVQIGLNAIDGEPAETKPTAYSINPCVDGCNRQKPLRRAPGLALRGAGGYPFDGHQSLLNQVDARQRPRKRVKVDDPAERLPTSGFPGSVSRNTRERSVRRHKDEHCALRILTPQTERLSAGVWDEHREIAARIQRERGEEPVIRENTVNRQSDLRFSTRGEGTSSLFELMKPRQMRFGVSKQHPTSFS